MRSTMGGLIGIALSALPPLFNRHLPPAVQSGHGVTRVRDRRHKPRVLDEAARAKHAAKMRRRYDRWVDGLIDNPCVSREQFSRLFFSGKE